MTLLAVGLSFRNVPLSELERVSVRPSALPEAVHALGRTPGVDEVVLISTCNRTEVYAWAPEHEDALPDILARLEEILRLPPGWLAARAHTLVGDDAVRHLFTVTVGLDSMVPGEWQIQGQVRDAYRIAVNLGTVGPHLDRVFRAALATGKRARAESRLVDVRYSLPGMGVAALAGFLGGLQDKTVLIVGAGKMGRASLEALAAHGAEVQVTARRAEAADTLAATIEACTIAMEAVDEALRDVDAVIYATAAPHILLFREGAEAAMRARDGRPLVILDLGLPRNVEIEVGEVEGVSLFDLERLHRDGFTGAGDWAEELELLRETSMAGAEELLGALHAHEAKEFVVHLHELADRVAAAEAERVLRKAPELDERAQELVNTAVNRAVRKLLHTPTTRGKEAAARGDVATLDVARWLFDVGEGSSSDGNGRDASTGDENGNADPAGGASPKATEMTRSVDR